MHCRIPHLDRLVEDLTLLLAGLLAMLGWWVGPLQPAVVAQDSYPGWHSDLARAAEISAASKKPIFAVFRCVR